MCGGSYWPGASATPSPNKESHFELPFHFFSSPRIFSSSSSSCLFFFFWSKQQRELPSLCHSCHRDRQFFSICVLFFSLFIARCLHCVEVARLRISLTTIAVHLTRSMRFCVFIFFFFLLLAANILASFIRHPYILTMCRIACTFIRLIYFRFDVGKYTHTFLHTHIAFFLFYVFVCLCVHVHHSA